VRLCAPIRATETIQGLPQVEEMLNWALLSQCLPVRVLLKRVESRVPSGLAIAPPSVSAGFGIALSFGPRSR
jgi:hypothetical protein